MRGVLFHFSYRCDQNPSKDTLREKDLEAGGFRGFSPCFLFPMSLRRTLSWSQASVRGAAIHPFANRKLGGIDKGIRKNIVPRTHAQ